MKFSFLFSFVMIFNITAAIGQTTGSVSGTVLDENGEPLIGATVVVANTVNGVSTDFDGNYKIEQIEAGTRTLVFSFLGYSSKKEQVEVVAGQDIKLNVEMGEDVLLLDKVVVVGYGTKLKRDLSSSVVSVDAEELEGKPVYNFTSSLQGKAAGVQITTDNGLAGAPVSVRIRGTKSLTSSAEPLYVIDGIPILNTDISNSGSAGYNVSVMSTLNPNDIESIQILKDAAATSIYGSRGANGVVLITTKSGKAGKTKFDISYNGGISTETNRLEMLSADQYVELHQEAWENDGRTGQSNLPRGIERDSIARTDWLEEVLRVGSFHEASLSASGGTESTTFYLGGTVRDEKSFLQGNTFQRASLRGNISHRANDHVSFGTNFGFTRTETQFAKAGAAGGLGMAQSTALPIYPVFDENDEYFQPSAGINPVAELDLFDFNNVVYRILNSTFAEFRFAENFSFRNEFGIDYINQIEEIFNPPELTNNNPTAEDRRIAYTSWNLNTTLNYKKEFSEKHRFEALVGFNPTRTAEKFSYVRGSNFAVSTFTQPQGATTIEDATAGTGREFSFVSFFNRINYDLNRKYMFQFSFRADGSSRFGKNNRFGYFPAVSMGWILSEEKFLKNSDKLTFLKVRASVGTTGNAELRDDFAQQSFYSTGQNYNGESGIGPSNTSVDDLRWETTLKTDLGIEFGLWNSRLSGTLEFYNENTYDMLIDDKPLAPSSGFASVAQNLGALYNRGFEFQLTSHNLGPTRAVQWKTDLNISAYKNKITDLGDVKEVSGTNFGDNRAVVGSSVGAWSLAEFAGVDPSTGLEMIYDTLGNMITATAANTVANRVVTGQPYPKFYGGITNSVSWNNFDLDIHFVFSYGQNLYDDHGKRQLGNMAFGWNQDIRTLERWQQEGDETDVPKLSLNRNQDFNTTRHLYDASYLRLRNVTLAYNVPEKILKKAKLRSAKIYISGQNLFVLTPYKGWDPEVNRDGSGAITQGVTYLAPPQARSFSAGFNIGL